MVRVCVQRNDIATAISKYDQFDFLIDIVPREDVRPTTKRVLPPLSLSLSSLSLSLSVCVCVCLWLCVQCVVSNFYFATVSMPSVLWRCWLGDRKGIRSVKKLSGGMLVWLSVWGKVQTCIWPSWCHCHSLSLASIKSRLVLPFWYRLTRVVPEKGPLNGCSSISSTVSKKLFPNC